VGPGYKVLQSSSLVNGLRRYNSEKPIPLWDFSLLNREHRTIELECIGSKVLTPLCGLAFVYYGLSDSRCAASYTSAFFRSLEKTITRKIYPRCVYLARFLIAHSNAGTVNIEE
jgi:hypothetical protein